MNTPAWSVIDWFSPLILRNNNYLTVALWSKLPYHMSNVMILLNRRALQVSESLSFCFRPWLASKYASLAQRYCYSFLCLLPYTYTFSTINLGSKLISSRFAKFAYLPALGTVFVFQFPLSGRLHTLHLDTVFVFSHPSVPIAHFLPCHRCVFPSLQHLASCMLAALGTCSIFSHD